MITTEKIAEDMRDYVSSLIAKNRIDEYKYKSAFRDTLSQIEQTISRFRSLSETFKKEGLTLNQLETEGGVRALLQLQSEINNCITPKEEN